MNRAQQLFIKKQLYNYQSNKNILSLDVHMLGGKHLLQTTLFVLCIENVFKGLSKEMQRYIQIRYFEQQSDSIVDIAVELSVSERTLNRWDELIVMQIANCIAKFRIKLPFSQIK